jgi:hypothetical protein
VVNDDRSLSRGPNMKQYALARPLMLVFLIGALSISACGSRSEEQTPTVSGDQIQTQAVATFSIGLTQTALANPTETPTATSTPSPTETNTPAVTPTTSTPVSVVVPTNSCYSLAFVADVTIPDNTNMTPSQKFTKTWRVRNNGSCTWEAGFKFNFTGGESMGGSSISLQSGVSAGAETELTVQLTAPSTIGTYRGNWRMTDAAGTYFGDEVYVQIIVGGSTPTATTSVTATATHTQTPTLTETVSP